jgi:hypothetical protein
MRHSRSSIFRPKFPRRFLHSGPLFLLLAFPTFPITAQVTTASSATAETKLATFVIGPREESPNPPGSPTKGTRTTAEFNTLLSHPEQWTALKQYIGAVLWTDAGLKDASEADLTRWMSTMRALHLTLEIESGVLKPWSSSGEKSFKKDSAIWDKIIKAGGVISAVAMDEPLPAAERMKNPPMPTDKALDEIAIYVALVHQHYPQIKVGLINAYPHFSPAQAAQSVNGLQDRLKQKGVRGLDFYRMDPNWIAFVLNPQEGSWDGMKQIQQYCDSIGLPFSLIYWAADDPREVQQNGGVQDDHYWYNGLLKEGAAYAGTGARPDQTVIESWVRAPSQTVPEDQKLTFTGSALDLLRTYAGPPPAH